MALNLINTTIDTFQTYEWNLACYIDSLINLKIEYNKKMTLLKYH